MVGWFVGWMVGWGRLLLKRMRLLALLALLTIGVFSPATAQEEAQTLEWLTVELWPDYDQPAVLVLLTGALSEEAALPATVTIPLPSEANVNAVARISADNVMVDDVDFSQAGDSLTLQTPDRRFRVEYYMPYASSELSHRFSFQWQADLNVEQVVVTVQQPRLAPSIDISPQPDVAGEGNDGLQYYSLPIVAVPANQPFTVDVQYTLERAGLSVDTAAQERGPDWLLLAAVAAAILLLVLAAILLWPRLSAARQATPRKPAPRKPAPERLQQSHVRYCHNCGQPARPGDRFCRQCGTELRGVED